jgi:hypothetical protein
LRLRAL